MSKKRHKKKKSFTFKKSITPTSSFIYDGKENFCFFLSQLIAKIDQRVNNQLDIILQSSILQTIEATWRNLSYMVFHIPHNKSVKIRVINLSKLTLQKDLKQAIDFDQSQLFKKVYSEEFGMPGGEPYGVLIGDYQFSNTPEDRGLLQAISQVAAAAFAPFIANSAPALFGLDDFKQLGGELDLYAVFKQKEYLPWRQMTLLEDMRFVGLTLPEHLLRLPYKNRHCGFNLNLSNANHYLWGNASFSFGITLMRAFSKHGWLGNIRGHGEKMNGGGVVPSALSDVEKLEHKSHLRLIETNAILPERQERALASLGFIPLNYMQYNDHALFYTNHSLQKAKRYESDIANENANVATMLQYIFCASRFAHYVKVIGRDLIGSFQDAQVCQNRLNVWLLQYTAANLNLSLNKRAKYPLQEASVKITECSGKPGSFLCRMHLKPCFQLEQLMTTITFVTELTSGMK